MHSDTNRYVAAVYPFTRDFAPFCGVDLTYEGDTIGVRELVAPKGMGIGDMDAGLIDNRGALGHHVETDLWRALDRCNSLFIVPGDYTEATEGKLVGHAERAIASGKHILCGVRLRPEQIEALRSQCKEKGVDFVYFPQESSDLFEGKPRRMYRPNAPVVFVGEVLEGINAIDVTLALISHFRKQGFRTSAILPSDLAALCGAHSHQEFASPTRPEEQRIEAMNYAMKKIDTEEIPDVIIVQLPGGVLPINDIATSQFGVHAFMWSQAVTPDCFVLCAPFQAFEETEYAEMNRLFTYRYGYAVDCVHLSNATLDMMNLNTSFEVSLYFAPMDEVARTVLTYGEEASIPTHCVLLSDGREKLCAYVENVLSSYGDAQAL